jgi:hypothetical protein
MKKRSQHYVSRFYLKPWAVRGQLCCLRAGKLFSTSPNNVAHQRDFYRLRELTERDIQLIEQIAIRPSPPALHPLHRNLMNMFWVIVRLRTIVEAGSAPEEVRRALDEAVNDTEENLHAGIESGAVRYIDAMLAGDTSFFDDDNDVVGFLYFLCVQHLRTKQMHEAMLASFAGHAMFAMDRIWPVLRHVFATNSAWSLYAERRSFRLVLLDNLTDTPLITGDQPIVNVLAKLDGTPPDDLAFYYPLSPRRAMLLTQKHEMYPNARGDMRGEDVERYNARIWRASHEQVFSCSAAQLEVMRTASVTAAS